MEVDNNSKDDMNEISSNNDINNNISNQDNKNNSLGNNGTNHSAGHSAVNQSNSNKDAAFDRLYHHHTVASLASRYDFTPEMLNQHDYFEPPPSPRRNATMAEDLFDVSPKTKLPSHLFVTFEEEEEHGGAGTTTSSPAAKGGKKQWNKMDRAQSPSTSTGPRVRRSPIAESSSLSLSSTPRRSGNRMATSVDRENRQNTSSNTGRGSSSSSARTSSVRSGSVSYRAASAPRALAPSPPRSRTAAVPPTSRRAPPRSSSATTSSSRLSSQQRPPPQQPSRPRSRPLPPKKIKGRMVGRQQKQQKKTNEVSSMKQLNDKFAGLTITSSGDSKSQEDDASRDLLDSLLDGNSSETTIEFLLDESQKQDESQNGVDVVVDSDRVGPAADKDEELGVVIPFPSLGSTLDKDKDAKPSDDDPTKAGSTTKVQELSIATGHSSLQSFSSSPDDGNLPFFLGDVENCSLNRSYSDHLDHDDDPKTRGTIETPFPVSVADYAAQFDKPDNAVLMPDKSIQPRLPSILTSPNSSSSGAALSSTPSKLDEELDVKPRGGVGAAVVAVTRSDLQLQSSEEETTLDQDEENKGENDGAQAEDRSGDAAVAATTVEKSSESPVQEVEEKAQTDNEKDPAGDDNDNVDHFHLGAVEAPAEELATIPTTTPADPKEEEQEDVPVAVSEQQIVKEEVKPTKDSEVIDEEQTRHMSKDGDATPQAGVGAAAVAATQSALQPQASEEEIALDQDEENYREKDDEDRSGDTAVAATTMEQPSSPESPVQEVTEKDHPDKENASAVEAEVSADGAVAVATPLAGDDNYNIDHADREAAEAPAEELAATPTTPPADPKEEEQEDVPVAASEQLKVVEEEKPTKDGKAIDEEQTRDMSMDGDTTPRGSAGAAAVAVTRSALQPQSSEEEIALDQDEENTREKEGVQAEDGSRDAVVASTTMEELSESPVPEVKEKDQADKENASAVETEVGADDAVAVATPLACDDSYKVDHVNGGAVEAPAEELAATPTTTPADPKEEEQEDVPVAALEQLKVVEEGKPTKDSEAIDEEQTRDKSKDGDTTPRGGVGAAVGAATRSALPPQSSEDEIALDPDEENKGEKDDAQVNDRSGDAGVAATTMEEPSSSESAVQEVKEKGQTAKKKDPAVDTEVGLDGAVAVATPLGGSVDDSDRVDHADRGAVEAPVEELATTPTTALADPKEAEQEDVPVAVSEQLIVKEEVKATKDSEGIDEEPTRDKSTTAIATGRFAILHNPTEPAVSVSPVASRTTEKSTSQALGTDPMQVPQSLKSNMTNLEESGVTCYVLWAVSNAVVTPLGWSGDDNDKVDKVGRGAVRGPAEELATTPTTSPGDLKEEQEDVPVPASKQLKVEEDEEPDKINKAVGGEPTRDKSKDGDVTPRGCVGAATVAVTRSALQPQSVEEEIALDKAEDNNREKDDVQAEDRSGDSAVAATTMEQPSSSESPAQDVKDKDQTDKEKGSAVETEVSLDGAIAIATPLGAGVDDNDKVDSVNGGAVEALAEELAATPSTPPDDTNVEEQEDVPVAASEQQKVEGEGDPKKDNEAFDEEQTRENSKDGDVTPRGGVGAAAVASARSAFHAQSAEEEIVLDRAEQNKREKDGLQAEERSGDTGVAAITMEEPSSSESPVKEVEEKDQAGNEKDPTVETEVSADGAISVATPLTGDDYDKVDHADRGVVEAPAEELAATPTTTPADPKEAEQDDLSVAVSEQLKVKEEEKATKGSEGIDKEPTREKSTMAITTGLFAILHNPTEPVVSVSPVASRTTEKSTAQPFGTDPMQLPQSLKSNMTNLEESGVTRHVLWAVSNQVSNQN